jgi:hypothetical protein
MTETIQVKFGALRWQLVPECQAHLLGPNGLRLEEWLRTGQAQIVKNGPHRTVYRVILPGLHFFLKHYRLVGWRARIRELLRPSKARMEFVRAQAVNQRQVPTVCPLALGERGGAFPIGDSYLITRSLDDTQALNVFIEKTFSGLEPARQPRLRQHLARELAQLMARMHDAGMVHNDLHPANLLLRLAPDDRPQLYVIDLHAVRLGRPLDWRASRSNLIVLNRWFILRVSRTDRLRFWRAYCRARGMGFSALRGSGPSPERGLARDLESRTRDSNWSFWRNRDRRCLVNNRYYHRLRSGGMTGYAVNDLEQAALKPLLADPDEPFRRSGALLLKDSRSSTVTEFDLPVGGQLRRVIYKRFRVTGQKGPWLALLRPTGALRSWIFGHGLRERCLPTPRPLAMFQRRRLGFCQEEYLLTEKISQAVDLRSFVASLGDLPAGQRRACLRGHIDQVARLVRELHQRRLSQRDLKAANILVTRGNLWTGPEISVQPANIALVAGLHFPHLWLIDLVGITNQRKLSRRRRLQNLARLHASFQRDPALTRTDKLRFLRVYLEWGLRGRSTWKRWWRAIDRATWVKVARNLRTGRPLV